MPDKHDLSSKAPKNESVGFDHHVWQVHKFGGTSVATAECFQKVASIVEDQIENLYDNDNDNDNDNDDPSLKSSSSSCRHLSNLAIVVSAMGGKPKVTDLLLDSVEAAANRDNDTIQRKLDCILNKHATCLEELPMIDSVTSTSLMEHIRKDIGEIRDILKTVSLMKWKALRISELVSGYGETWSAQILAALLSARSTTVHHQPHRHYPKQSSSSSSSSSSGRIVHHTFRYLDARRVITIDENVIQDGAVCWDISQQKLQQVYQEEYAAMMGLPDHNKPIIVEEEEEERNIMMHFVITGYVASNTEGVATTLQRDGSDYSAAIMGRLLQSKSITIWTDVDGILSADPRRVPDSYILPEVSYNEAMELAYFGAKVIHPKTMQPAIMADPQIPIYIRNTFHSSFRGSRIFTSSTTHTDRERCVCGFSSIEKMAVVNVEGSGMLGVRGVARRLFGTLESIGVNVVLISQASSEHSITFATTISQAQLAKDAIEEEFHKEIKQNRIAQIDMVSPCSIIAAVGDGMHLTTGVAGRFFSALGDAKINILAISQGSSERNISAVVLESESTRALRAIHAAFRLSHTNVRVGIIGMSQVGESLLKLLDTQRQKLKDTFEIDLQVCAVLQDSQASEIVVLENDAHGVDADSITIFEYNEQTGGGSSSRLLLGAPATSASSSSVDNPKRPNDKKVVETKLLKGGLLEMIPHVHSDENPHSIIFDCTGDTAVGAMHAEWLKAGIHVVTANSTGLAGCQAQRDQIKAIENTKKVNYLREVAVGGALPVLSTLRDLLSSGDTVRRVDGILSVSMSYIMHRIAPPPGVYECSVFDEDISLGAYKDSESMSPSSTADPRTRMNLQPCSFRQAVKEAIALGLMEEDPILDLNNEYTARCLMVLARDLHLDKGYDVDKIKAQSDSLVVCDKTERYSEIEDELDATMKERVAQAAAKGCVPRHTFSVDSQTKNIAIHIVDVPYNHIFATTAPSCECVRFFTKRHATYPLIVQGPSAGVDSTASALLAEVLNLMKNKVGPKSGVIGRTNSSPTL